jgi:hypothetical protein
MIRSSMDRQEIIYDVEQKMLPEEMRDCLKCKGRGYSSHHPFIKCRQCDGTGKLLGGIKAQVGHRIKEAMGGQLGNPLTARTRSELHAQLHSMLTHMVEQGQITDWRTEYNEETETLEVQISEHRPLADYISMKIKLS